MTTECEEAPRYKRYYYRDLHPLTTTHASVGPYRPRSPAEESGTSVSPASSAPAINLAWPLLGTVRKYYQYHGLRIPFQTELSPMEYGAQFSESLSRRHSVLSPGSLAIRMERIAVSPLKTGTSSVQIRQRRSMVEISRDMLLDGVNHNMLAKLCSVVSVRPSTPHRSIFSPFI